jgi:transposase
MGAAATKVVLIDRHARAAEMLADGKSVRAIAAALEVDRTQVWRWLQRPEVAEHYLAAVNAKTARLAKAATIWMEKALSAEDIPPAVKVAVARLAFERADKLQERANRTLNGNDANVRDESEQKKPAWTETPWAFVKGEKK